ncbi:MAG: hypothetical protein ABIO61_00580 [Thermomonas sp.]
MKRAMLPQSLDPADLPRDLPQFRHWFRYSLHRHDFQPLRAVKDQRLLGYYTAKPLYGRLDDQGRVDKSASFNGEIAGVFVPSPARSWRQAELFFTKMPKDQVAKSDGQRNWPAIHAAAELALHERLD